MICPCLRRRKRTNTSSVVEYTNGNNIQDNRSSARRRQREFDQTGRQSETVRRRENLILRREDSDATLSDIFDECTCKKVPVLTALEARLLESCFVRCTPLQHDRTCPCYKNSSKRGR
mmetsp:Transcript_15498/g.20184  ORF Transcript_15498/g.20184 Transcript_15498/m.20184 type:complete len:118 (+) Transcript_15498:74-427(+)